MPIKIGFLPSKEDLLASAAITEEHIEDAKRVSDLRAPSMRPAFYAELIEESEDPGPIPDAE